MNETQPPAPDAPKTQQMSLQVGRDQKNKLVVIARDMKPVVLAEPRYALVIASALVKHASIILASAAEIDDVIEQALARCQPPKPNGDEPLDTDKPPS